MCQYCLEHGAGKKWYLNARNYLKNFEDDRKRAEFVKDFISNFMDRYAHYLETGEVNRILNYNDPNIIVRYFLTRYFRNKHSGQVVPQEEAKQIMELAGQISLVPCVCRMANAGIKKNLCMVFLNIPEDRWGYSYLEGERDMTPLEIEEAQHMIDEFADDGLVQTVWTFDSPHIGAVCNCDYPYCSAVRFRKDTNVIQSLFKSEYVGKIDQDKCTLCRKCISMCQFGALTFSNSAQEMILNEKACFGCGICRNKCSKDAITLIPREDSKIALNMW